MLPRFLKPGIAVANHAESGETLKAFINEHRLEKVLDLIRPGDYLFIQFAHNDMKPGPHFLDPFTSYRGASGAVHYHGAFKGATPVLVTSVHRRTFDVAGRIENSLGDYPEAVRRTARKTGAALLDLTTMSRRFYEALGAEGSKQAFVDNTHHNSYGSYELAKCVVEGLKAAELDLSRYLVDDLPAFDPSRPDPVGQWTLPASPNRQFGPAAPGK